jgi:hypothetical protein
MRSDAEGVQRVLSEDGGQYSQVGHISMLSTPPYRLFTSSSQRCTV